MKKIALVLAVLLFAVPAWAGVTVYIEQPVDEANEIYVMYDVDDGDVNRPRAFALEITVDGNNPVLSAPYDIHSEYYVYPGSIQISGGVVTSFGTPVAVSGSNTVTIEMGSLWAPNDPCHTDQPPENGILMKFTIDTDEEDGDCTVSVNIAGNAPRGKVVMEDPDITWNDPGYVTYTGVTDINICEVGCPCWGDIANGVGVPPGDGTTVDFGDLTYLIGELSDAGWSIAIADRPDLACADIANGVGVPPGDGLTVDFGDLTYLIGELSDNGWSMPCMSQ